MKQLLKTNGVKEKVNSCKVTATNLITGACRVRAIPVFMSVFYFFLVNLFSVYSHISRCFNAQSNLFTSDAKNTDFNLVPNEYGLIRLSTQYQHINTYYQMRRRKPQPVQQNLTNNFN